MGWARPGSFNVKQLLVLGEHGVHHWQHIGPMSDWTREGKTARTRGDALLRRLVSTLDSHSPPHCDMFLISNWAALSHRYRAETNLGRWWRQQSDRTRAPSSRRRAVRFRCSAQHNTAPCPCTHSWAGDLALPLYHDARISSGARLLSHFLSHATYRLQGLLIT